MASQPTTPQPQAARNNAASAFDPTNSLDAWLNGQMSTTSQIYDEFGNNGVGVRTDPNMHGHPRAEYATLAYNGGP